MNKIQFIRTNKGNWDRKTEINVDNKLFKVIGIGPKAFKVLWFGPTPGSKVGIWNQCWWKYSEMDAIAEKVVDKMYSEMSGSQTTL